MKKSIGEISILKLPIKTPADVAFSMAEDDKPLIRAICDYAKELRRKQVEVFKREKNVIATELGYFFAMYEEDRVLVDSGLFNPEKIERDGHQ